MDRLEQKILSIIDEHAEELKELATKIYYNAERGFMEYETAKAAAESPSAERPFSFLYNTSTS